MVTGKLFAIGKEQPVVNDTLSIVAHCKEVSHEWDIQHHVTMEPGVAPRALCTVACVEHIALASAISTSC